MIRVPIALVVALALAGCASEPDHPPAPSPTPSGPAGETFGPGTAPAAGSNGSVEWRPGSIMSVEVDCVLMDGAGPLGNSYQCGSPVGGGAATGIGGPGLFRGAAVDQPVRNVTLTADWTCGAISPACDMRVTLEFERIVATVETSGETATTEEEFPAGTWALRWSAAPGTTAVQVTGTALVTAEVAYAA